MPFAQVAATLQACHVHAYMYRHAFMYSLMACCTNNANKHHQGHSNWRCTADQWSW
jgi:hypothetical protein